MKNKVNYLLLPIGVLLIIMTACGKKDGEDIILSEEESTTSTIDKDYYRAFSMNDPYAEILHDSINNLIIVADRSEGQIVSYNYRNHEVSATTNKDFFIGDYELNIFSTEAKSEIYLANNKTIYIYDAISLELTDSITIFDSADIRFISSIEAPNDNILLLGLCNSAASGIKKGSISLNKKTKEIIAQAHFGGNCLRLRSYELEQGNIGVIGVGYATSRPELISDIYTANGELIENNIEFFAGANTSLHLLKTSDSGDFFITESEGNIFNKVNLEFLNSLNGSYSDVLINGTGKTIYGLSRSKAEIEKIDYNTLNVEERITLNNFPIRGFFDENNLIVVYFNRSTTDDSIEIYLSELEI